VHVISLLPAATEIVASLGMLDALLGVSHECDYPEEVSRKPLVTHCEIHGARAPKADLSDYDIAVIDEASMLDDRLLNLILSLPVKRN
jgi:hypothetical protein